MTHQYRFEDMKSEVERGVFEGAKIEPDENLIEARLLDSLNLIKLISLLEKRYEISFVGREMRIENFRTFRAISSLVEHKISGR